jgi:hypothetical protein
VRASFVVSEISASALRALNFSPVIESFRRLALTGRSQPLGSLLSSMGPAFGSVFTRVDCEREHGIELLSQTDMLAAEPEGRIIRRDSMLAPEEHLVRKWQILIAGAGTLGETELYGRSVIADGRLEGKYVGPHAMVLTFKEPGGDMNLYTYAFLCSPTGIGCVRSTSYGTKVLGLRPDLLANLPVPLPSDRTLKRISALVRRAVIQRERFLHELTAARSILEDLPEMVQARSMCVERRARCIIWEKSLTTLSAWNYASTGGALAYLQRKWSGRLKDAIFSDGIFLGDRFPRIPCSRPNGIEFLTQRDVFVLRPVPRVIVRPNSRDERLLIAANTLLTAGRGTLGEGEIFGRVALPHASILGKAVTGDLLRIVPHQKHVGRIYAFLSTQVGLRLLRSTAVGTKILAMRPDLLRELPIPDLKDPEIARIDDHLLEAVRARDAADSAEIEANRIIEEEVLPEWLA